MKRINKKQSTQTDGSGGAKMSVKDKIETKMKIAELKEMHLSLCQRRIELENVPCAIDMEICHIEEKISKEYAKLGISMTDLPEKQKEGWK
ncbi:MAG: hypothetical protein QGH27_07450 [SAR324 cluster bacterium]|nr:hypothetical protein [SAR324 cluster bacterium]